MTRGRLVNLYVAVVATGGAVAGAVVVAGGSAPVFERPAIVLFLAAVLAVTERFPLLLLRNEETEGLQLEEAFLIALALVVPEDTALIAFTAGAVVGLALRRRPVRNTLFNTGQAVLAASTALAVMHAISPLDKPDVRMLAAAAAGGAVFFAVNSVAVATVIALAEGTPLRRSLGDALRVRAVIWAGSVSLGLLLGIAVRAYPWVLPCLVAPLAILYWSFTGHLRAWRAQRRMSGLFRTAMEAHAADRVDDVAAAVAAEAARLLDCDRAEIRRTPATDGELGVRLPASAGDPRWLVVGGHRGVEPFASDDEDLLAAVAAVGAAAIDRADLHEQAEHERRRLADIVASSSDGIFSVSSDLEVRSWNPAMERLTGVPTADAIGARCGEVFRTSAADCGDLSETPRPALLQLATRHGQERWVTCSFSPLPDGGYAVVARDVTAEEEAKQLKSDFLAMVSHELRTPLTPIKGFLHTLLADRGELDENMKREIHELMLGQTERLQRLVLDLLDATSLGDPDHRVVFDDVDWATTVRRTVDLFRHEDPERVFDLEVVGDVPQVRIDEQRGEQVLANLVENARRYSPSGTAITVTVTAEDGMVRTTVADQGPGVPPADRELIFERFRRLGNHLHRPVGGLGLGLFIARRLVERMGGLIGVDDAPGGGAAFSFTLPMAPSPAALASEPAAPARRAARVAQPTQSS